MGTLAWVDLNCCSSFIFGMGHCIVATFLVKQVNNVNMDDVTLPSSVVTLPADVEGSSIPAMLDDEPSSKASRVAVDECLEVDLPMMVSDDDEVANAFDDCIEPFSDSEEDFMDWWLMGSMCLFLRLLSCLRESMQLLNITAHLGFSRLQL